MENLSQNGAVKHTKTPHVEKQIHRPQAENASVRTLQNALSALCSRTVATERNKLVDPNHEKLSNLALGLLGVNRDDTKTPITDEMRRWRRSSTTDKKPEGVAIAVKLSRCLGLRTEETVQSVKSLKAWKPF